MRALHARLDRLRPAVPPAQAAPADDPFATAARALAQRLPLRDSLALAERMRHDQLTASDRGLLDSLPPRGADAVAALASACGHLGLTMGHEGEGSHAAPAIAA